MPLSDGYGVVIGDVHAHYIDDPDNEGKWPHFHIEVAAPPGVYDCAINLKSRTDIKIEYRAFFDVDEALLQPILTLAPGFHALQSSATSGALDVVRHPGLRDPTAECAAAMRWCRRFCRRFCRPSQVECTRWWNENGLNAVKLMQYFLEETDRIYVFGEPFTSGLGLHNIHMNQGDPIGSPWSDENGIWQDGGVIYQYTSPQPRTSILLTKFETQVFTTGNDGKPLN